MAIQAKRCTECGGLMELRLGSWECQLCGHKEPAQDGRKSVRRRKAVRGSKPEDAGQSSPASWKKEHGTHMLDFSKGSGRQQQPPPKSQPPPHQPEYQEITEFTKREQNKPKYYVSHSESNQAQRSAEKSLAAEKLVYFGLWLLLSAYVCYLLVSIISLGLFSIDLKLHEVIYIAVVIVAVMIGVMWYTLYAESRELKWIFVILGCLTAFGQAVFYFVVLTNQSLMEDLTFNSGNTGVMGLVAAAVLTVSWTIWYVYILYRDIQNMQA